MTAEQYNMPTLIQRRKHPSNRRKPLNRHLFWALWAVTNFNGTPNLMSRRCTIVSAASPAATINIHGDPVVQDGDSKKEQNTWEALVATFRQREVALDEAQDTINNNLQQQRRNWKERLQQKLLPLFSSSPSITPSIPTRMDTRGRLMQVLSYWYGTMATDRNQHASSLHRLLSSTPKLIIMANAFLLLVYLAHVAMVDFFLGESLLVGAASGGVADGENGVPSRGGQQRHMMGFMMFKVLLISAVVTPDPLDLLLLLLWYSTLSLLKSLSQTAHSTIQHAHLRGHPPPPKPLYLLLLLFTMNILANLGMGLLFRTNVSMVVLLTCDGILIGNTVLRYSLEACHALGEERFRRLIGDLEERIAVLHDMGRQRGGADENNDSSQQQQQQQQQQQENQSQVQHRLEQELHWIEEQIQWNEAKHARQSTTLETTVFILETSGLFAAVAHYVHIWVMHGMSFGLLDAVLFLHIQSTLSSVGRKIAERKNLNHILHQIDSTFHDASDLDLRKASTSGDVCCICLVSMTTGVKKVGCGHLFHKHCLREVVERARSLQFSKCPLCRASLVDGSHASPRERNAGVAARANGNGDADMPLPLEDQTNRQIVPNNNNNNTNLNEQSLFRFSTEGILPAWLPVPAFAFEVVRRETPALAEQNNGNTVGGLQRFFRRGGQIEDDINENDPINGGQAQQQQQPQQQQQQQSFWRRLFILAGAIPMSPEEEAMALEQLVDMFPQYDRADLSRELRTRGSSEAVVESILLGIFSGTPRGGGGQN